jgi:hypothetical protein
MSLFLVIFPDVEADEIALFIYNHGGQLCIRMWYHSDIGEDSCQMEPRSVQLFLKLNGKQECLIGCRWSIGSKVSRLMVVSSICHGNLGSNQENLLVLTKDSAVVTHSGVQDGHSKVTEYK